jgi:hypothetical protein
MHIWVRIWPNAHRFLLFRCTVNGDKDHQLNIIREKKISPLFSWYCNVMSPMITRWFNLDDTAFQAWCMLPSTTPTLGTMLLNPTRAAFLLDPLLSMTSSRVSNVVSLTTTLSRKIAPGIPGTIIFLPQLTVIMLITSST